MLLKKRVTRLSLGFSRRGGPARLALLGPPDVLWRSLALSGALWPTRVQKKQPLERDEYKLLKSAGLVKGRFPSIMVAGEVAKATGNSGRHIRERGFDTKSYFDLILELVRQHGPVGRAEVDQVLIPKLPERMTEEHWPASPNRQPDRTSTSESLDTHVYRQTVRDSAALRDQRDETPRRR